MRSIVLAIVVLACGLGRPATAGEVLHLWTGAGAFDDEAGMEWPLETLGRVDLGAVEGFELHAPGGVWLRAERLESRVGALGERVWTGDLEGGGQVVLAAVGRVLAGYLHSPEGSFEIAPSPEGPRLLRLDGRTFPPCGTGFGEDEPTAVGSTRRDRSPGSPSPSPPPAPAPAASQVAEIDLLGLYTAEARRLAGGRDGIRARILVATLKANLSFSNSQVAAALVLKDIAEVSLTDSALGREGTVQVVHGSQSGLQHRDQIWHQNTPAVEGGMEPRDDFGSAVAVGDFNGDAYAELAVGVPGEDVGSQTDSGVVQILYGASGGLSATVRPDQIWYPGHAGMAGSATAYERFGHALAVGDFDGDAFQDLAIGVPGAGAFPHLLAGNVRILFGSSFGLSASRERVLRQGDGNGDEAPEPMDGFGSALAAGDLDGDHRADLAVGVPGESFGTGHRAGVVEIFYGESGGPSAQSQQLRQGAGRAGKAEPDDGFGHALAIGDFDHDSYRDLAVGIPGEDVGHLADAGAVQVFFGGSSDPLAHDLLIHQDSEGIAGLAEAGDRFGQALAAWPHDGLAYHDLVVGSPGEGVDGQIGAGMVVELFGSPTAPLTSSRAWHQAVAGVEGSAEFMDEFGSSLALGDFNGDGHLDLAVGIPGEGVPAAGGNISSAGAVAILHGDSSGLSSADDALIHRDSPGIAGEARESEGFGFAVAAGDFDGDDFADLAVGVPSHGFSNNGTAHLAWLSTAPEVAARRDRANADLVGLVVVNADGICGKGYLLGDPGGDDRYAFQITRFDCLDDLSWAHETGHNLGMQHDPDQARSTGVYDFSHGHYERIGAICERSVMSYDPGGCVHVPFYSDPGIDFPMGVPSGTSERDNAETARRTVPGVASYK